jgi:hypothetical protein
MLFHIFLRKGSTMSVCGATSCDSSPYTQQAVKAQLEKNAAAAAARQATTKQSEESQESANQEVQEQASRGAQQRGLTI